MRRGVHRVFHQHNQRERAQLPYRFLFFSFLLTDNTAFLSFKSSPHIFRHHLALFLFFTVVSSLSHNLVQTLPKSYSQSTCLNRHGLWCYTSFLFIEVGPLPSDISESNAGLCNVHFPSFSAIIYWLKQDNNKVCAYCDFMRQSVVFSAEVLKMLSWNPGMGRKCEFYTLLTMSYLQFHNIYLYYHWVLYVYILKYFARRNMYEGYCSDTYVH